MTNRSCPGTSTNATSAPEGSVVQANPRSIVMPRRRSSAHRSGSIPVSARTSVDLPWSTCPAVATTCMSSTAAASVSSASGGSARRSSRQRPAFEAAQHRGLARPQRRREGLGQRDGGARQRDAGRTAAADRGLGLDRLRGDAAAAQELRQPRRPGVQRGGSGVEALPYRRGRAAQGGLHRGEGQLVHPQRAGERVPAQAPDQLARRRRARRAAAPPAGRRAACRPTP